MNKLPKDEIIRALKAQLHHFDHSPDFGDGEAVQAIRKHLLLRIQEAEGALRSPAWVRPQTVLEPPALHSEAA